MEKLSNPRRPTQEEIAWAIAKILEFSWMDGFPKTETGIECYAKQLLRIVKVVPDVPEETDRGVIVHKGAELEPATDRLLSDLGATFTRFPSPILLRKLWEGYGWMPGDGMEAAVMEVQ